MLAPLAATLGAELLLLVIGVGCAVIARRLWRGVPAIGLGIGIIGIGVVGVLGFVVGWLARSAVPFVALAVVVLAVIAVVAGRMWRWWRRLVAPGLAVVGLTAAYIGTLYLWRSDLMPFRLAEARFEDPRHLLPVDNQLPAMFADVLRTGASGHHFFADWNGSDRPPLQSGLVILLQPLLDRAGMDATDAQFGVSVAAQLLWAPGVYLLARALGGTRAASLAALIGVGVAGTTVLNTVFTWPKLLSGALVLASAALLLIARRRPARFPTLFPLAVAAFLLAALSHGAAAFALPLVVVLGVIAWRRQSRVRIVRAIGASVVTAIVLYLPWILYQRLADPPGDRLLKWHLAGVIPIDGRSFAQALADQYTGMTPGRWLATRIADLRVILANPFDYGWPDAAGVFARRDTEFTSTTSALGISSVVLVVVVVLMVIASIRHRERPGDRGLLLVIVLAGASILFWTVLMFAPGATIVHQGSQVWLVVLVVAPLLWIWRRRPVVAIVLIVIQSLFTAVYYAPTLFPGGVFSKTAALAAVGGLILCVAAAGLGGRRRQRRTLVTEGAR